MSFERFEINEPQPSLGDMFDSILEMIDEKGISGANTEPEVCVILRTNIKADDGLRSGTAIIYIGATPQEIAEDLKTRE